MVALAYQKAFEELLQNIQGNRCLSLKLTAYEDLDDNDIDRLVQALEKQNKLYGLIALEFNLYKLDTKQAKILICFANRILATKRIGGLTFYECDEYGVISQKPNLDICIEILQGIQLAEVNTCTKLNIKCCNLGFGSPEKLLILANTIAHLPNMTDLDLNNNHLAELGISIFSEFTRRILENQNFRDISFEHNQLWTLDLKTLSELYEHSFKQSNLKKLRFWITYELDLSINRSNFKETSNRWNNEQRFEFAKLCVRFSPLKYGTWDLPYRFELSSNAYFELLSTYFIEDPEFDSKTAKQLISNCKLEDKHRHELLAVIVKKEEENERKRQEKMSSDLLNSALNDILSSTSSNFVPIAQNALNINNIDKILMAIEQNTIITSIRLKGEIEQSELEKIIAFIKGLKINNKIIAMSFECLKFDCEGFKTLIEALGNNGNITCFYLNSISYLIKLHQKEIAELVRCIGQYKHFMQPKDFEKVQLWKPHHPNVKEESKNWNEDQRLHFAKLGLEFDVLAYSGGSDQPYPFSLKSEQYLEVFLDYYQKGKGYDKIERLRAIKKWGVNCQLDAKDIEKLETSIFDLQTQEITSDSSDTLYLPEIKIDKNRIPILLTALQKNNSIQSIWFGKDNCQTLDSILVILDAFKNSKKYLRLIFYQTNLFQWDLQALKNLIYSIGRIKNINSIDFSYNKLWSLDAKSILELIGSIQHCSFWQGVRLWNPTEEDLKKAAEHWDESQRFEFAKLQMSMEGVTSLCYTPAFPFSLTIEQYKTLFSNFMETYPDKINKVQTWVREINGLAPEDLLTLKSEQFIESLKNNGTLFQLNLEDLKLTSKNYETYKKIFMETTFPHLKVIQLDVSKIDIKELSNYMSIFNLMKFQPWNEPSLEFSNSTPHTQEDSTKILSVLTGFKNTQIKSVRISTFIDVDDCVAFINAACKIKTISTLVLSQALKTLGYEAILRILKQLSLFKNITEIGLSNNGFSRFSEKEILSIINCILSNQNLTKINLTNNQFPELGLKFLSELLESVKLQKSSAIINLWCSLDYSEKAKLWDEKEQLEFVRLQLQAYHYTNNNPVPFSFPLSNEHYFNFMVQYINDAHENKPSDLIGIIETLDFPYENKLTLAKLLLEKKCWFRVENYNLKPEDRLDFFFKTLNSEEEDSGFLQNLRTYNLFETELPASRFFGYWDLIKQDIWNEQFETCAETFQGFIFYEFCAACRILFPNNDFYDECLDKLGSWIVEDSYDALKLMNMAEWFTWLCAWVTTKPNLDLRGMGKIFKEIIEYPDPDMRYKLTNALLNQITDHPQNKGILENFISKLKTNMILPGILMHQILSNNKDKEKQEALTLRGLSLLKSMPLGYKEGQFLRSFVGALQTLAGYTAFSSEQKIGVIEHILNHPINASEKGDGLDKQLEVYAKRYISERGNVQFQTQHEAKTCNELLTRLDLKKFLKAPEKFLNLSVEQLKKETNKLKRTLQQHAKQNTQTLAFGSNCMPSMSEQQSRWFLVQGLGMLNDLEQLITMNTGEFEKIIQSIFKRFFKVTEDKLKYYKNTFLGLRNETALYTYLGKIRSLEKTDRAAMERVFEQFVQSVLSENNIEFYQLRYDEHVSPHLKMLFSNHSLLKAAWMKGDKINLNEFIKVHKLESKPINIDYKAFLYKKIFLHNHISSNKYGLLKEFLEVSNLKRKEDIRNELKLLINKTTKPIQFNMLSEKDKMSIRSEIQLNLIALVDSDASLIDSKEKARLQLLIINNLIGDLRKINEGSEFQNDLKMLQRGLSAIHAKPSTRDISQWMLVDTDYFWDAFMAGTDVMGSCQRVDGSPSLNKCLMAYVMDGKNRLLAIKDETGKMIARCIFRLLWDQTSEKPVLFLEQLYPEMLPAQLQDALMLFACQRAKALNLTLLSSESTQESRTYQNSIESLGSIAPHEYVDALHNAREEGIFTISKAQVIHSPYETQLAQTLNILFPIDTWPEKAHESILGYCASDDNTQDTGLQFAWPRAQQSQSRLLVQSNNSFEEKKEEKREEKYPT